MRSKEFITEEYGKEELISYLNEIKKDCQPFLNEWGNVPLIRGVKTVPDSFVKKEVRLADRRPKDTPRRLHNKFNKALTELTGLPYRNGMFASGRSDVAADYGNPYIVFPMGNFKYIWSGLISDLYGKWQEVEPREHNNESPAEFSKRLGDVEDEYIKKSMPSYKSTDLPTAINSGHEIMFWTTGYYGIHEILFNNHQQFIIEYLNEK